MLILNQHQAHLKTIRNVFSYIVAPAEYIINWPSNVMNWIEESVSSKRVLLLENENLKGKVLQLKAHMQKLLLLEQENAQLRKLLESSPKQAQRVLVAKLLEVDPDPFAQQVILNKGKKEGAYLGQPVLDGQGVFGQVIQVGEFTSRVMLITDSRSAVPVQDSITGIRGVLVGKGDSNELQLIDMPATANIHVGDELTTSGLGEKFPVGYPVGTIKKINKSSAKQFANVIVAPSAHINSSHLVLLIWPDEAQTIKNAQEIKVENKAVHKKQKKPS